MVDRVDQSVQLTIHVLVLIIIMEIIVNIFTISVKFITKKKKNNN